MTTALDDSGVMFADGTKVASARELLHLNDIVNGDFRIAQAGTSFAAAADAAYDLDGWQNGRVSTAVCTIDQIVGSTAGRLARRNTITTIDDVVAAGDYVTDYTKVEGSNVEKYVGNTFTIAFRARVPVAGIHCVSLINSGFDRSYVKEINFPVANAWQNCSFTVVGGLPTAGVWNYTNGTGVRVSFAHLCGVNFQTTPDAWNTGLFFATANQVNDCATLSNVWAMEKVTMNLGTVAAVSEIDVGAELQRCQRYLWPIQPLGLIGYAVAAERLRQTIIFPAMRATPTVVQPAFSYANAGAGIVQAIGAASALLTITATATGGAQVDASGGQLLARL